MKNNNSVILEYYNIGVLLDKLVENQIDICNGNIIDDYHIKIKISSKELRKIKKMNINYKIEYITTFSLYLLYFFKQKILIFSLILSSFYFLYLNSKIHGVFINGQSESINLNLKKELKKEGIDKNKKRKSNEELNFIQKKTLLTYQKDISNLSIYSVGNYVFVEYELRPKNIILETTKGKIFSKYDAVVSTIRISKGNVLVNQNQFVKKGELIVDDVIIRNEKEIYIGTKGNVYGYVYFQVEKTMNRNKEDVELFQICLIDARYDICSKFIENEELISEKILKKEISKDKFTLFISFLTIKILNDY